MKKGIMVAAVVVVLAGAGLGAAYWAGLLHTGAPAPQKVDLYSWKDADGVTHFTQDPGQGHRMTVDTANITRLKTEGGLKHRLHLSGTAAEAQTTGDGTDQGTPAHAQSILEQMANNTGKSGGGHRLGNAAGDDQSGASPANQATLDQMVTERAINEATQ